jgi:hypothetical protein
MAISAVLLAMPMMLRLPLISVKAGEAEVQLYADQVLVNGAEAMQTMALLASITVAVMLVVYAIMQYKNRKFQANLLRVSILSQAVFLVLVFFYLDKMNGLASGIQAADTALTHSFSPLLSAPVVAIFMCMLAIRAIGKDEALVRSADRLR